MILRSPVLVHSDSAILSSDLRRSGRVFSPQHVASQLLDSLAEMCSDGEDGLVFPAFNYDFGQTGIFNVENDPVQVGALPEWIRQSGRFERTPVPFFSVLHRGAMHASEEAQVNPFGPQSVFAELLRLKGTVLLAGVGVDRLTILHFIEDMFGPPLYRYDKLFVGTVQTPDSKFECRVKMHVRPPVSFDYDWEKIEFNLREQGILEQVGDMHHVTAARVDRLVEYLGSAISENPTYLLPGKITEQLFPSGHGVAQRLRREDFEGGCRLED